MEVLKPCSLKPVCLSNACFWNWEVEKWSKSLRRPKSSDCVVSALCISFHAVHHWKGRMSITSRTWCWEIYGSSQRYIMGRFMWFSLVLLCTLCILKNPTYWDCCNLIACYSWRSRTAALLPQSLRFKLNGESWLTVSMTLLLLPIPSTAVCCCLLAICLLC